jgi:hypothetical protein
VSWSGGTYKTIGVGGQFGETSWELRVSTSFERLWRLVAQYL